ncbi:MAG TPA: glycine betaine ABC transporter substrate-binding protein [Rhodanobacteraceae bacterium]|nr:glycine betaine ABC transporter substrate-binding protein [Rhodanobacteraceae bacterium]
MFNRSKHRKFLGATLAFGALALAGCSSGNHDANSNPATASTAATPAATAPQQGGTIKLAYVEWSSCVASTDIVAATLESKGYKVKTISVSAAAMFEAVAQGDADAMVCAWLPTTHGAYYAKTQDQLDNLGPSMTKGTRLGLVVPDYVTINSITQLPAHAKQFQDRIIGIDPGAGIMSLTQKVIEHYKLPEKLVSGSGATMTAALKDAIDNHQWVVVTGWSPHWMWARFKLKYLDDPDGIYGAPDDIDTLARKGLQQDMPGAYAILDNFQWTAADMEQVMAENEKNNQPEANAKAWVKDHPTTVAEWTAGS